MVCFDFPPNEGIGGRRWAKLAKQLAKNTWDIHVIKCAPKDGMNDSPWKQDVTNPKIKTYELPRTYPVILSNPKTDFLGKLNYKFNRFKYLSKYKGTIYDNSLGWERYFDKKASEIIEKEGIVNVVVTGAPFNLFDYTCQLKKKFPSLNIVVDYRDPWINAQNYGMQDLNPKRKNFEQEKQQFVLETADHVVYPSDSFEDEIMPTVLRPNQIKAKFHTLTHFYDQDDLNVSFAQKKKSNKIKFLYGGTVYMAIEPHLNRLADILDQLKEDNFEWYQKLQIEFYTTHLDKLKMFDRHQDVCSCQMPIGKAYHEKLKETDFLFILLAEHNKHYRTTKFMETLPYAKPFAYLGPEGDARKFLLKEKLGYSLDSYSLFCQMLEDFNAQHLNYNYEFDFTEFSLASVAQKLESFLVK